MSRRDAPAGITVEWARASLETGEGLDTAVAGTEVIIHAASSSTRRAQQVDVVGTERLLAAAHRAGVGHFIYISIVGIEQVPFPYYRYKLAAEKLVEAGGGPEVQTLGRWPGGQEGDGPPLVVEAGGVPWSILRTTQFHNLLDLLLHCWPGRRSSYQCRRICPFSQLMWARWRPCWWML